MSIRTGVWALVVVSLMVLPAWSAVIPASGLQIWLDGSNVDGQNNATLTDGDALATWKNLSTDGSTIGDFTQTAAAWKPTFKTSVLNGKSVVRFDGGDAVRNATTIGNTAASKMTVFTVNTFLAGGRNQALIGTQHGGAAKGFRFGHGLLGTNNDFTYKLEGSGAGYVYIYNPSAKYTPFAVSYAMRDGLALTLNVNAEITSTGTVAGFNPTDRNQGTMIGASPQVYPFPTPGSCLTGDIAEIIVYDRVLSSSEIDEVGYYLSQKYDVQTSFVPEPATMSLLLTGAVLLAVKRRRHRK